MSQPPTQPSILVVEDDADIRDTVAGILELEGYAVEVAGDGARALALLDEKRPTLVMLDLMMPSMNGRQFMTEMATRPKERRAKVVLISAGNDLAQIAEQIGAVDSLRKPISLKQLLAVVRKHA